ncbi:MAG TPA: alpha/beta hydrolase fold domain-containing protein [Burkholderiaceae bacterium]
MTLPTGASPGDDLTPDMRRFQRWLAAAYAKHPPLDSVDLPEARLIAERVRAPLAQGGPQMVHRRDLQIDTPRGPLRLRVHTPTQAVTHPALVYLHGGGWVFFSIDTHDRLMREIAARAGRTVIGVDYARSPEARYPAAREQAVAAWRWARAHAVDLGLDAARIALGGDSAGANLALAAALVLRDAGERPDALLLNYGVFGDDDSTESYTRFDGPAYNLGRDEMRGFWDRYLGVPRPPAEPLAAPLKAELAGLPRCCLVVPECDVLRDDSLALAQCLRAAGVDVALQRHPGAVHSFLEAVSFSESAERGLARSSAWLRGDAPA